MKSHELSLPYPTRKLPMAARVFIGMLQRIGAGSLRFTDPQGQTVQFGVHGAQPQADLQLHDWRAASAILRQGDIGFAESYRQGWLDSSDLLALFTVALRNEDATATAVNGRWWALLLRRLGHLLLRDNNRRGSRRNIAAHYDLGNGFYRLWLDPSMSYSAGIFDPAGGDDLEAAQWAKYDRILDQLDARPGQTILEVGCGWGGFAERAARRGLRVHGITLSQQQLAWAQQRMRDAGLDEQVSLALTDYRDVTGQYDHIVSIEMLEAVGERWWPTYFATLARLRKPGGRIVIQSIDIADARFDDYRRGTDFIQQYIFPGGMLPSPARLRAEAARAGFGVLDEFEFGLDYATTLRLWRESFEARLPAIAAQGFDESFIRLWRMYYLYCEAGFRERRTGVRQWTLC